MHLNGFILERGTNAARNQLLSQNGNVLHGKAMEITKLDKRMSGCEIMDFVAESYG